MRDQFNTRGRGSLGTLTNSPIPDPGTSARIQNRPSVPTGTAAGTQGEPFPGAVGLHLGRGHRRLLEGNRKRTPRPSELQTGSRGREVQRLQRLLNSRLYGEPALKVDGRFGPKTRAAVIEFQKESELETDGIVGRKTWFALLSAPPEEAPKPAPAAAKTTSTTAPAAAPEVTYSTSTAAPEKGVDEWSMEDRFEYVLQHTGSYLAPDLRAQFAGLLTPGNLAIMIGCLVVWAAGHFFGVSELTDAFLLGFGLVYMGRAALDAARDLKNFLELTCTASTEKELDEAASDLAQAVAIIGVVAFFTMLGKIAQAAGKAAKAADEGVAVPEEEVAPKTKPDAESPKRGAEPEEPKKTVAPKDPIAAKLEGSEFNGVKADRVRPGSSGKVAVIGRSMPGAVEPFAKGLQEGGYDMETFGGDKISPSAQAEWQNLKDYYAPERIPDDVVPSTQMFQENQAWAQKLANQGYTVVDVDNPGGQSASPFYEMEKATLFGD